MWLRPILFEILSVYVQIALSLSLRHHKTLSPFFFLVLPPGYLQISHDSSDLMHVLPQDNWGT